VGYNIEWRKNVCFAQWHKMSGPGSYGEHYRCLCIDKPNATLDRLRRFADNINAVCPLSTRSLAECDRTDALTKSIYRIFNQLRLKTQAGIWKVIT
jgi:hypothetical protein